MNTYSDTYTPSNTEMETVSVWDPLVRVFHWSLVLFFFGAWISGDEMQTLHTWLGYGVAMLLVFRLIWGVIGTRHARFQNFTYRPANIAGYLKSLLDRKPEHYAGHNPAGGLMVFLLLSTLVLLSFSGLVLSAIEGSGPLTGTFFAALPHEAMEDSHEVMANFLLILIFLHIAGVVVSSILHKENLVKAMITGRKQSRSGNG